MWSDDLVWTLTHLHVLGREANKGLQEIIRLITLQLLLIFLFLVRASLGFNVSDQFLQFTAIKQI